MKKTTAATLDQAACQAAFKLYQDRKFRWLIKFDNLPTSEQDRIFNELVVSGIILLMLTLESPDLKISGDRREDFLRVAEALPKAHCQQLASYGIEKKYLVVWQKLIKMRHEEYSQDKLEVRKAAIDIDSKRGAFTAESLEGIQLLLPLQTVAIGCHHHICRGKTKEEDELFKSILHWLSRFYVEVRVQLEGGKITLWKRVKVKIHHFWKFVRGV